MTINLELYSPRWGHTDKYTLIYNESTLTFALNNKNTICTLEYGKDPIWSELPESINSILINEDISMPEVLPELFEFSWKKWKDGTSKEKIQEEMKILEKWLNTITNSKPTTDFWSEYF